MIGVLLGRRPWARWCRRILHAYLGGGLLSILLLMAAGIPEDVCATASVPIAAGFMHMGALPVVALAFLIAGSATNAATFTTVWHVAGTPDQPVYLGNRRRHRRWGCGLLLGPGSRGSLVQSVAPHLDTPAHQMLARRLARRVFGEIACWPGAGIFLFFRQTGLSPRRNHRNMRGRSKVGRERCERCKE